MLVVSIAPPCCRSNWKTFEAENCTVVMHCLLYFAVIMLAEIFKLQGLSIESIDIEFLDEKFSQLARFEVELILVAKNKTTENFILV